MPSPQNNTRNLPRLEEIGSMLGGIHIGGGGLGISNLYRVGTVPNIFFSHPWGVSQTMNSRILEPKLRHPWPVELYNI